VLLERSDVVLPGKAIGDAVELPAADQSGELDAHTLLVLVVAEVPGRTQAGSGIVHSGELGGRGVRVDAGLVVAAGFLAARGLGSRLGSGGHALVPGGLSGVVVRTGSKQERRGERREWSELHWIPPLGHSVGQTAARPCCRYSRP